MSYRYERPATGLSTVQFLWPLVCTPFGNTSLELNLLATFAGLQRVTLLKSDPATSYSFRIRLFAYCYNCTCSWSIEMCSTETSISLWPLILWSFSLTIIKILKEHSFLRKLKAYSQFFGWNWTLLGLFFQGPYIYMPCHWDLIAPLSLWFCEILVSSESIPINH